MEYVFDCLFLILYMPVGNMACNMPFWMRHLEQWVLTLIKEKTRLVGLQAFLFLPNISFNLKKIFSLCENLTLLIVKQN